MTDTGTGMNMDPVKTPSKKQELTPPPAHGVAHTNAPATPGPSTATATAAATASAIAPSTPDPKIDTSATPKQSVLSTPGGTTPACRIDKAVYTTHTIRTAKCTECDKRNDSEMFRCPGCTFQVCKSCCERREADGRGLVHGNVNGVMSPDEEPIQRRKPSWAVTPKAKGLDSGKSKQKAEGVSSSAKRKQAARKKAEKEGDTTPEGDDFMPESPVPNLGKRRRTTSAGSAPSLLRDDQSLAWTAARVIPRAPLSPRSGGPLKTIPPGVNLKDISAAEQLEMLGIKQDEPLLGRQVPVIYHTTMRIPEKLKNYNKSTGAESQEPEAATQVGESSSTGPATQGNKNEAKMPEVQNEQTNKDPVAITVRSFVTNEAKQWLDDAKWSDDEKNIIFYALLAEARRWLFNSRMNLAGLNMRLDGLEVWYLGHLADVVRACATRTITELEEQKALEQQSAL
ncbi:hypothetical protein IQ07DRAFT_642176 [Pyrenochaeta sp. DS3sAY3a]|nr:hypothetical protein IQ07DRAFT_642176 [Pyrenochaeta sp. DS3sAY3a]